MALLSEELSFDGGAAPLLDVLTDDDVAPLPILAPGDPRITRLVARGVSFVVRGVHIGLSLEALVARWPHTAGKVARWRGYNYMPKKPAGRLVVLSEGGSIEEATLAEGAAVVQQEAHDEHARTIWSAAAPAELLADPALRQLFAAVPDPMGGLGDGEASTRFLHVRLGARSMDTTTHRDHVHQLVAVANGRKRFVVVHPAFKEHLGVPTDDGPHPFTAACNLSAAADEPARLLTEHPQIGEVQARQHALVPGDVLFLPRHWFHYVRTDDALVDPDEGADYHLSFHYRFLERHADGRVAHEAGQC